MSVVPLLGIICILAGIAVPLYNRYRIKAFVVETASDLKNFSTAFHTVAMDYGEYSDDSHIILPPGYGIEGYITASHWLDNTPLGGNYNWDGPDFYPYAGIAILGATAMPSVMASLDAKLDDGDLTTGRFRITPNGRHTYILEE